MAQVAARGFGKEGPMSHKDKKEYVRGVMGPTGNRAAVESKAEEAAEGGGDDDETSCDNDCELQGVDITPAQNGYSVTSRHKKPSRGHVGQGAVASEPYSHDSQTHVFGHHSQVAEHVQRLLTQHNLQGKTEKVPVAGGGSGAIDKG